MAKGLCQFLAKDRVATNNSFDLGAADGHLEPVAVRCEEAAGVWWGDSGRFPHGEGFTPTEPSS